MTRRDITENRIVQNILMYNEPYMKLDSENLYISSNKDSFSVEP